MQCQISAARKRKSYALRIHPRRELRKVITLSREPPPLPPARLELGTFEDKSQPQFSVMLRTKCCIMNHKLVESVGGVFDPVVSSAIAVFEHIKDELAVIPCLLLGTLLHVRQVVDPSIALGGQQV